MPDYAAYVLLANNINKKVVYLYVCMYFNDQIYRRRKNKCKDCDNMAFFISAYSVKILTLKYVVFVYYNTICTSEKNIFN